MRYTDPRTHSYIFLCYMSYLFIAFYITVACMVNHAFLLKIAGDRKIDHAEIYQQSIPRSFPQFSMGTGPARPWACIHVVWMVTVWTPELWTSELSFKWVCGLHTNTVTISVALSTHKKAAKGPQLMLDDSNDGLYCICIVDKAVEFGLTRAVTWMSSLLQASMRQS